MTILTSNAQAVGADSSESRSWQTEIKAAVRTVDQLCDALALPDEFRVKIKATGDFPVFATPSYLARIPDNQPDDPLLRQILPVTSEDIPSPGFSRDPLSELDYNPSPGLLHKYAGRALLIVTGACAIHCRYCFRRHFPYQQAPHAVAEWGPALEAISADDSIEEVLLSGGDPLMLVDTNLEQLIHELESIPHLRRLRIHTRLPIMVPSRINQPLLDLLKSSRLQSIVVIHSNHARELDLEVEKALSRLRNHDVLLLNQSVLLRGVNNHVQTLKSLSERLLECQVVPYYLHQLDRVSGAAHFEVSMEEGKRLVTQLRAELPGYAVPRYVQEVPGEPNKTVIV